MPDEHETQGMPPVPGVCHLGWLLFMRPIALHKLYRAWGVNGDPTLIRFWRSPRLPEAIARPLLARYAVLLLAVTPVTVIVLAGVLRLSDITLSLTSVAVGAAGGMVLGALFCLVSGVATGVALGVTVGVSASVAVGWMVP